MSAQAQLEEMTIGELVDYIWKKEKREKLRQEKLDKEKADTERLKLRALHQLEEEGQEGGRTKLVTFYMDKREHPSVEDPDKFFKYVKNNDAFELIQRRVNASAWREMTEQGARIPGIKVYEKVSLRFRSR